jgi:hypothetical protein
MGVESLNSSISTPTLALLRVPGQKLNGLQGGGNRESNERSGLNPNNLKDRASQVGARFIGRWQLISPDESGSYNGFMANA